MVALPVQVTPPVPFAHVAVVGGAVQDVPGLVTAKVAPVHDPLLTIVAVTDPPEQPLLEGVSIRVPVVPPIDAPLAEVTLNTPPFPAPTFPPPI